MPKKLEFLCLANSQKLGGRCVAGISLKGGWVRLVSKRPGGALSEQECRLDDGSDPKHFDVICARVDNAQPEVHQPENFVVANVPWELKSRTAASNYKELIERHLHKESVLLGIPGKGIAFQALQGAPLKESLALFVPGNPRILLNSYGQKRRFRALFNFGSAAHDLGITDLDVMHKAEKAQEGEYDLKEFLGLSARKKILFLVSITEPFDANRYQGPHCFKLVASILAI
jgi:hypothetical protein